MSLCTMVTISGEFMPLLVALQTIAPVESNCWVLNEGYLSCNACRYVSRVSRGGRCKPKRHRRARDQDWKQDGPLQEMNFPT